MALKGTLKDFGIADILQLIGQQQKTGVLMLTQRGDTVAVTFKDGSAVIGSVAPATMAAMMTKPSPKLVGKVHVMNLTRLS